MSVRSQQCGHRKPGPLLNTAYNIIKLFYLYGKPRECALSCIRACQWGYWYKHLRGIFQRPRPCSIMRPGEGLRLGDERGQRHGIEALTGSLESIKRIRGAAQQTSSKDSLHDKAREVIGHFSFNEWLERSQLGFPDLHDIRGCSCCPQVLSALRRPC